ncbi:MAG: Lon protease [Alphaproteobacteria bacterium MarineAlpha9_Bin4]|nr:endopeptidase La [Pelagibacterales bacterium]PPR25186.1 MAG: Lon protease [Alphaproteobacteria bacterium MarineAlpha9_Bin4]|tara:strand:- start:535 stop:2922 length:2388 start_codon:yes stop_codon:yes gene_type:complete
MRLPLLPLRDIVIFPDMIVPLFVGREKSVVAVEKVMKADNKDKSILLITQKESQVDNPSTKDLYKVGVLANVLQMLKLPDGTVKVLVEGVSRVIIKDVKDNGDYISASLDQFPEKISKTDECKALVRAITEQFDDYVKVNKKVSKEVTTSVSQIDDPIKLSNTVAAHLGIKISEKQELLEIEKTELRLTKILELLESELDVLKVEKKIRSRVKRQMEKTQREYYLNEQLKAIQKELGDNEDGVDDNEEFLKKIHSLKLTKEARKKAESELKKLKNMSPMSAESTVVRNYLDWLLNIPWKSPSRIKYDLASAIKSLDQDHFGLEKVKERIIEYLAIQKRVKKVQGSILCLVGPPGVGKTSLGKSIAKATGRKFVRISLGGVRDEAEIKGHRRTYIGSMPGKIIQGMKKAGSSNPLFLLDEIDKLGADWRGDPSSALLEALDPEQNSAFSDHYLEVDYDLSNVLFITTANSLNMPQPLLDRMEVIKLSGYTETEKLQIAKNHLLKKQYDRNGLSLKECSISDAAVTNIIKYYTREAGVRNLEREISKLCRKTTTEIVKGNKKNISISANNLQDFLGVKKFRHGEAERKNLVGVTTGLAYTDFGGDILAIEAVLMPGKGRRQITGHLGEVMKESIQAAVSYVRYNATLLGIIPPEFEKKDIHVHVPEGATPKDGPSAGIAIVTSIVSILTGIPVNCKVAMTGEITLRGRVLPIGGLKEKLLAALRSGISKVIIPKENEKDLEDIPDNVKKSIKIIVAENIMDVLKESLSKKITPIDWKEDDIVAERSVKNTDENLITH